MKYRRSKTFSNHRPNQPGYRRTTQDYPSREPDSCDTSRKETQMYSGTQVKGIGLLHKQSYTPITDDAIEVSDSIKNH